DTTWFLHKDKFVVDFAVKSLPPVFLIGRKTTTYRNIKINDSSVTERLSRSDLKESVEMEARAMKQPDSFWQKRRHEELSLNEKKFYQVADTLLNMPAFKRFHETINFIGTGYMNIGN